MSSPQPVAPVVDQVLRRWPVTVRAVRPYASVYQVTADEGLFCLKPIHKSQSRLYFMHRVQEHIRAKGFDRIGFLLPTARGDVAAWLDDLAWTLSEWVTGRELNYRHTAEVARGAAVLAQFHRAAADFPVRTTDRFASSNLGKWPAKVAARCGELLTAARLAGRRDRPDGFDRLLAGQATLLVEHARRSLLTLNESSYGQRTRSRGTTTPVCHGDPAAHNFILGPDRGIRLIDLNSLRADLQCVDLWKLLHRMGFWCGWDRRVIWRVIEAYQAIRPLDLTESTVLLGLLWFPEKQWRLVYNAGRHLGRRCPPDKAGQVPAAPWPAATTTPPEALSGELELAAGALVAKERCLRQLEDQLTGS